MYDNRECTICHRELQHGDDAYGITRGEMDYSTEGAEGFTQSYMEPWVEVICPGCWLKIDKAIGRIMNVIN